MDSLIRTMVALITGIEALLGAPIDGGQMPDRPPIVAPTDRAAETTARYGQPTGPAEGKEITGTITQVQLGLIVVNGQPIAVTSQSIVTSPLKVGSVVKVQVEERRQDLYEAQYVELVNVPAVPSPTSSLSGSASPPAEPTTEIESDDEGPEVEPTSVPGHYQSDTSDHGDLGQNGKPSATVTPGKPAVSDDNSDDGRAVQSVAKPTAAAQANPTEKIGNGSDDSSKTGAGTGGQPSNGTHQKSDSSKNNSDDSDKSGGVHSKGGSNSSTSGGSNGSDDNGGD